MLRMWGGCLGVTALKEETPRAFVLRSMVFGVSVQAETVFLGILGGFRASGTCGFSFQLLEVHVFDRSVVSQAGFM